MATYETPTIRVLFSEDRVQGRTRRLASFWGVVWILNRLIGRSRLDHVAVEADGMVAEGTYTCVRILPSGQYRRLRRIRSEIVRDVFGPARIDAVLFPPSKAAMLLRILTLGRWRSRDCVSVVSAFLRQAGYPVPRHILTVKGLHRWLTRRTSGSGWRIPEAACRTTQTCCLQSSKRGTPVQTDRCLMFSRGSRALSTFEPSPDGSSSKT
ncbi:MAG: hypothetical protein AAGB51_12385 [Planctomycetota bacterium]